MFLSGLVGFLLLLTTEANVGSSSELDFCTETEECLLFEPVCNAGDYEVRHYRSVKWVSTDEVSYFMEMASMRAFRRLYRYISGDNREGEKVAMTSPVLVKITKKGFWQQGKYTMSFLLPSEHQASPPEPTDDKVYVQQTPNMTVFVRSYGGWMSGLQAQSHANTLRSDVTTAGGDLDDDFYFSVGYNSPMTFFNRHNEVWYLAEDEPACGSSEELDRRR